MASITLSRPPLPAMDAIAFEPPHNCCFSLNNNSEDHSENKSKSMTTTSILQLCQDHHAPPEVLSHVLSYAGLKAIQTLSRCGGSFWKAAGNHEMTYQMLCVAMGKYHNHRHSGSSCHQQENTPSSSFWKQCYWDNVSVPHDFETLREALKYCHAEFSASARDAKTKTKTNTQTTKHMRILLQPGSEHRLDDASLVVMIENTNNSTSAEQELPSLTIETATLGSRWDGDFDFAMDDSGNDDDDDDLDDDGDDYDDMSVEEEEEEGIDAQDDEEDNDKLSLAQSRKASIIMDTEVANLPMFRLQQGHLILHNLQLDHFSPVPPMEELVLRRVRDENAAILLTKLKRKTGSTRQNQTNKRQRKNYHSNHHHHHESLLPPAPPTLTLDNVGITSFSGRGVLNRAGRASTTHIRNNSYVSKLW